MGISFGVDAQITFTRQNAAAIEEIYVARSLRAERGAPTQYCAPAKTGFEGTLYEDRYTFRSVAVGPDGLITDSDVAAIGTIRTCLAALDAASSNFYAEGRLGVIDFVGRGECRSTQQNFPEQGLTAVRCFLALEKLPPDYVGGHLTTNSLGSAFGDVSQPSGYVQTSIATVRLWKRR
jgi:hypothetical protein